MQFQRGYVMKQALLSLAALFFACYSGWADEPAAAKFKRKRDVVYGRKHGLCMTMDVFAPKEGRNGIGIVAVISGGWVSNHESIDAFHPLLGQQLVKRGYTVFAVVHGSQPKYSILECIDDLHRAIRFVRHNAKEYGIDPDRIGITGASAGCHLSLMMGVGGKEGNPTAKDEVERASSKVQAVAGFFPPTDFFNFGATGKTAEAITRTGVFSPAFDFREIDRATRNWTAVSDAKRKDILKQISPFYHVTAQTPPTLLVHGDKDALVPLQQSEIMIEKLKEHKVVCDLIVRKDGAHGWADIAKEVEKCADWFDKHLAKK